MRFCRQDRSMPVLLEASFTLNSVFPEQSIGFPLQAALGLACFLFPLLGFFLQVCFGKKLWRQGDWLPTGAMFGSFLCALGICVLHLGKYDPNYAVEWRVNWMTIQGDGAGVLHQPSTLARAGSCSPPIHRRTPLIRVPGRRAGCSPRPRALRTDRSTSRRWCPSRRVERNRFREP